MVPHHRGHSRSWSHSWRVLVALSAIASLSLASCGGGDDPDGASDPTDSAKPAPAPPVLSPITGLALKGAAPKHPLITVKLDNTASSRPQVGLSSADLMVEELVEGGITRLAATYYTKAPADLGPVRSMRASDIGIVLPLQGVLVSSGGAPETVSRVADAGIKTFTEGATGFYRESSRPQPYNLFMRLSELAKTLKPGPKVEPYLPFGDEGLPKGRPATGLTAAFSSGSSTSFTFADGVYTNTDTNAGADDQFRPSTVLVLRVRIGDAGYLDPAGNPVPETIFTGQGPAMIFNRGRLVNATWTKAGLEAPIRLQTRAGSIELPPGKVWIELVPQGTGSVTVTR